MLVLGRKKGEKVIVQTSTGEIVIAINYIGNGRVKLAIDAPKDMHVLRAELMGKNKN